MKKPFFVLLLLFAIVKISVAQPIQLIIKSDDKGLHLEHTVIAKEGFFSVGRIYNVHPKFLAQYNNLDIDKGLNIGQVLRIPLTDTNFTQKKKTPAAVYYTVGEKEGLLKVSNSNKKVKLQSLREWNKLSNDNINTGSKLVVGFLVNAQLPPAPVIAKEEPKKVPETKPVVKTETTADKPVVKEEPKKVTPAEEKPLVKEETKKTTEDKPAVKTEVPTAKPDVKEVAQKTIPVEEKPLVKEEPKKIQPVLIKQDVTTNMTGQGYFKSSFDQQVKQHPVAKTETVTSGIFNTVNGVQDAKYYLLINGITPGTVVRVINPDNNKAVYAKVLGEMSGYRQNQGLDIRISNLAAATLGINDMDKFIVKINY